MKYIIIVFSILLLVVVLRTPALGQSSISGIIKDASSQETLINATVFIEKTKFGAKTNRSGYYVIQNIPAGEYSIRISYLGYAKFTKKIKINNNQNLRLDAELIPEDIKTQEIEVLAEREILQREITISTINIPINQIKDIRIGGESDVFRTLQFLPGVLTSSQISSGLFVRGGSPDQNLVLLDGATIYNPSHLFGFFSTFNTNAIKDVEFIKGGFEAEYGGRLSSVLNITQKEGNKKKYQGSATLGLISSQLGVEGPIANGSFFLSGRRTYLDLILKIIPEDAKNPLPDFYFYDINAKIVQDIDNNNKLSITSFIGRDVLDYGGNSTNMLMQTGNKLISGRWQHIFNNNFFSTVNVNYSDYGISFTGGQSGYAFAMENKIQDISLKSDAEWYIKENAAVKTGLEINKLNFDYLINMTGEIDTTVNTGDITSLNLNIPDINYAFFMQSKFDIIEYLSTQIGIRTTYFQLNDKLVFDPRMALRYKLTGNIAIKAACGLYHQNVRIATNPEFNVVDGWLPSDTTVSISKSVHYIFSIETQPLENLDLNCDIYYKSMSNISELNMFSLKAKTISDVVFVGNAYSYGAELFLQKKAGRFTGWLGYGLGVIKANFDSINYGKTFRPKYDRLHDFKLVLQYKLSENWEFGGTFTLQSGQSYTGATSRTRLFIPEQTYGKNKIINSERYGLRLPNSHQMNLYGAYEFKLWGKDTRVVLDIYNIYNRRDILMRIYNTSEEIATVEDVLLLPIIPTFSIEMSF